MIAPTATLSAMPYTPRESMVVLRHLYEDLGGVDAFNLSPNLFASSNLAIDQGPIVVMIENHHSSLLWDLFIGCAEIRSACVVSASIAQLWTTRSLRRPPTQAAFVMCDRAATAANGWA